MHKICGTKERSEQVRTSVSYSEGLTEDFFVVLILLETVQGFKVGHDCSLRRLQNFY